ncbi:hypothetical protein [Kitasatospora kifunensis]|uniref:Uncharacterized protein n=1 Tax=Kitasatospora kifunensis TaxID=58351 RepID=A0A7W7VWX5_KITKI|nr:hypothetical protein [Kitasatospora kifunensis]MBB4925962.1 hypothetical protein [Kitasatospora kifunensis]
MTSRNPRDRDAPLPPTTGTGATVTRLPGTARRADGAQQGRPVAPRRRPPKPAPGRGRLPVPEGFPGPAELAPLARRMLADAVRIARWAGELESVDKRGELLPEDARAAGRALAMTVGAAAKAWGQALLVGLVEPRDGGAAPGWRLHAWEHDDDAVLRGWSALFDAWTLLAPVPPAALRGVFAVLAGQAVDQAPQLLSFLHLVDGPVAESELMELLRRGLDERRHGAGTGFANLSPVPHAASAVSAVRGTCREPQIDTPPAPSDIAAVLDWMLDGLTAVGAVVRAADAAELSSLGHWAVRAKLEEICTVAQTAAGHIEQSALELLDACAHYSPGPARAEYRAWVAARPVDRAVHELLEAARGEDALLRGLAFEALRVAGGTAEQAVRAAIDEPVLRPYALLWLAEQLDEGGVVPSDVLSAEDAAWLWVDTAAAVLDHGEVELLVGHVEGASAGDPVRLFARARQSGHARAASVLTAVASVHPDAAVARAARRSAFSVHHGGA